MASPQSHLPPGFRFHPTDEELILHYLRKKVASLPIPVSIIAEVDIYKFDPWDLPEKAAFGDKEWYFFSPRDRKYPNGARPNRAAASGYWKATGTDKTIVAALPGGGAAESMGVKKALVFYTGKPPKGVKTNWIMHEYRLINTTTNRSPKFQDPSSMRLDDWVLCRIYKKSKYAESPTAEAETLVADQDPPEEHIVLPSSQSPSPPPQNNLISQKSLSFSNLLDASDFSMLSSLLSDHYSTPPGFESSSAADNSNSKVINLDHQSFQNNHTNNSYDLFQRNPRLMNHSSLQNMENNKHKRQISGLDQEASYPSKRYLSSSCSFPNNNTNHQLDNPQWNFLLKQSLLNQQLILGPHHRFQG